jgi:TPR repeat protein
MSRILRGAASSMIWDRTSRALPTRETMKQLRADHRVVTKSTLRHARPTDSPFENSWTRREIAGLQSEANLGDRRALATLGILYRDGVLDPDGKVLLPRSPRRARTILERASALRDPDAMCALADELLRSSQHPQVFRRAASLYRSSFKGGNASAAYNLATSYQNLGRYPRAVRWYRRAYEAGDRTALFQLALAQLYGLGMRRDPAGALAKLRRVAGSSTEYWPPDAGENVEAMLVLANAFLSGWLFRRNRSEGCGGSDRQ